MRYRREIDGLRAIAVLPVVLFHAGFSVFSGGYIGVDVFFVISGYLITKIIISELQQGNFSIIRFYERRARRILPALFFVMIVCLPFAFFLMLPAQFRDFMQSIVAVVFFVSNVLFWREEGYFAVAAELKPLLHTWSLAVEEQYYLLFPVFLLSTWRFGRSLVFVAIIIVALASLLLSEWAWRNEPSANFYLAPTRAWELLTGSICAFLTFGRVRRSSNMLSAAGLSLIVAPVFLYDVDTPFPSVFALAPVGGTALIILFATRDTIVAKLLSTRAFVGIGLISYSLYLWHQPLFSFARLGSLSEPNTHLMAGLLVASILLAWGTWYWVEQPFRRKPFPVLAERRKLFATFSVFGAIFVAMGLSVHFGFAAFRLAWIRANPELAPMYEMLEYAKLNENFVIHGGRFERSEDCRFLESNLDPFVIDDILSCSRIHGSGTLILGDSHAVDLFGAVVSNFSAPFIVGLAQGACRPHTPQKFCHYKEVKDFIKEHPSVFNRVIYEQAGFYLLLDDDRGKGTRDIFSDLRLDEPVLDIEIDEEHVALTYAYLAELSGIVPVTWFGPRLEPHVTNNMLLRLGCEANFDMRPGQVEIFEKLDGFIRGFTANSDRVSFVSQNEVMRFSWPQDFMSCSELYFSDGDHYSAAGEKRFGSRLPEDFVRPW